MDSLTPNMGYDDINCGMFNTQPKRLDTQHGEWALDNTFGHPANSEGYQQDHYPPKYVHLAVEKIDESMEEAESLDDEVHHQMWKL